jgi:hypothetical protein
LKAPESEITAAPPRGSDGQRTLDLRAHDRLVAAQCAGVGLRGRARGGAAAGMQQHDRLAGRMRAPRQREEAQRMTQLLRQQQHHMRGFVVDQIIEEILGAGGRLISG